MLTICFHVHDKTLKDAFKELCPQIGVRFQEEENECDGFVSSTASPKTPLPVLNLSQLSFPIHFSAVVALLKNLPYSQEICFAHFSLNLREKCLTNKKKQTTQLITEKECQLLRFFHQNKGVELSKESILKEIWGYHPETQTHTLETHIYRLRQKLEEDPNAPQVLLNCKEGYWIK